MRARASGFGPLPVAPTYPIWPSSSTDKANPLITALAAGRALHRSSAQLLQQLQMALDRPTASPSALLKAAKQVLVPNNHVDHRTNGNANRHKGWPANQTLKGTVRNRQEGKDRRVDLDERHHQALSTRFLRGIYSCSENCQPMLET